MFAVDRVWAQIGEDLFDLGLVTYCSCVVFIPAGPVENRTGYVDRGVGSGAGLADGVTGCLHADGLALNFPAPAGAISKMGFKNLADVHAGGHTQRV